MADEMLEIGARVDVSVISAGMQQSAEAAKAATSAMKAGFDDVAVSSRTMGTAVTDTAAKTKEAAAVEQGFSLAVKDVGQSITATTAIRRESAQSIDDEYEATTSLAEAEAELEARYIATAEAMEQAIQARESGASSGSSSGDAEALQAEAAAAVEAAETTTAAVEEEASAYDLLAVATQTAMFAQVEMQAVMKAILSGTTSEREGLEALSASLKKTAAASAEVTAVKAEMATALKAEAAAAAEAELRIKQETLGEELSADIAKKNASAHLDAALGLEEEAQAAEHVATSMGHTTSSVAAASGAIRIFEGALPIRAVERFAVTTLGLGPILEAAFPIIGAIALLELVGRMAGEFVGLYNEVFNYSKEVEHAREQEKDLDKQFEQSIAVSDRLIDRLAALRAGRKALGDAGYDPSKDAAPTAAQMKQEGTGERVGGLERSVDKDADSVARLTRQLAIAEEKANAYRRVINGIDYGNVELAAIKLGPLALAQQNLTVELRNAQMQQNVDTAELQKENLKIRSEAASQEAAEARSSSAAARQAAAERRRAEQEEVRSWQEALTVKKLEAGAFYQDEKRDDMLYWRDILQNHKLSVAQRREVEKEYLTAKNGFERESLSNWVANKKAEAAEQEKTSDQIILDYVAIADAMEDAYGKGSRQAADAQRELARAIREVEAANEAADRKAQELAAKQRKPSETAQTSRIGVASSQGSEAGKLAQQELAAGMISRAQYEAMVAASEDRVYAIKLDALQKRRALEALDPNGPEETARTDGEIEKLAQDHEARLTEISNQQLFARAKAISGFFTQMSTGMNGAIGSWERGQGSFGASFEKTLGGMVVSLQGKILQMQAMWAAHYVQQRVLHSATNLANTASDASSTATQGAIANSLWLQKVARFIEEKVLHVSTNATKVASDAAAAASSTAIKSTAAITQAATSAATNTVAAQSAAGLAGANAVAATAIIPIVGPELAPAAGALAFTAAEGFGVLASASGGWDMVPADNTLANLHKNEMVLPANLAEGVRRMTGGSQSITQNFGGNTINGGGGDFPSLLDQHEDAVAYKVQSLVRDGRISLGR